jgi:two-component system sensor histidine kinase/response regulator
MSAARRRSSDSLASVASLRPISKAPVDPSASGRFAAWHEDLAGMLAHDLKTPLAALMMNLDYALSELPEGTTDAVRSALEDCRSANARAAGIIADMADAGRLESGALHASPGDIDVGSLLGDAVAAVAPDAATRRVRLTWSADVAIAWADATLTQRAIERLLERAVRHAPAGGIVEVSLRRGVLSIRVVTNGTDPDIGANPAAAGRALTMYFAETVIRSQGGAVWVENDADGMLVFRIAMPRPGGRSSLSP